jgi:hypothetical protein
METAKFAIVMLNTLRVVRFQTRDELTDAVRELAKREIDYIVFKYHAGTNRWIMPEQEAVR